MKKILSLVLTLAMLATMCVFTGVSAAAAEQWNGKAATEFAGGGDGTAANPYKIGTAAELKLFANIVNGLNLTDTGFSQNQSACAELTADIVLNTGTFTVNSDGNPLYDGSDATTATINAWLPIGYYDGSADVYYKGTFNGSGHTISGLYYNNTNEDYVALFGQIKSGANISNLGVVNSYIRGNTNVGGVCGLNSDGTITGCYNTGEVSGAEYYVGGVCGLNFGTTTGCYNTGAVSGSTNVGGICGDNGGTISGCYNTGAVSGTERVGGVCGLIYGALTGCYNTGTVSGNDAVGGVCGGDNGGTITGCYNTGAVSGNDAVGGVCGYKVSSTITFCYYLTGAATGGINGADVAGSAEKKTVGEMETQEFTNILNSNGGSFVFRGGFPAMKWQKDVYYGTAVTYTVDSIYYVDIPAEVTLGGELSVSASGVILEEGKQLEVALTGTSEADNSFKVTNGGSGVLTYTVANGGTDGTGNTAVGVDDIVLTVNPKDGSTGDTTLKFKAPTDTPKYSGNYTGTVTFTVSVTDQPTEFFLATDYYKNDTIALYCAPGTTWEEWIESADNIYGMQKDEEHIAIYGSSGVVDENAFILCSASTWDVDGGKWERSRPIEFVEVIKEITYVLVPASELMG